MSVEAKSFAEELLVWFRHNHRKLPWRQTPRNPYHVWLSEVMLQQTQVATVIPYFERWLNRFPNLQNFANAPLADVLKHWEGLGYYARARNFHKAAKIVVNEFAGKLPGTVDELRKLPGIGRYTAGAIASIAFGQRAAVLDGNVKRVYARVHGLLNSDDEHLWHIAESQLPHTQIGLFNEALMELGAMVCTPRAPSCTACPIQSHCQAYKSGSPEDFPQKRQRAAIPHHHVTTVLIRNAAGALLIGLRPQDGLLGGLWEFISSDFRSGPTTPGEVILHRTKLHIHEEYAQQLGTVKHAFTHFKITRTIWLIPLTTVGAQANIANPHYPSPTSGYAELRWATPSEIAMLALARSDRKIFELYKKHRIPTRTSTR